MGGSTLSVEWKKEPALSLPNLNKALYTARRFTIVCASLAGRLMMTSLPCWLWSRWVMNSLCVCVFLSSSDPCVMTVSLVECRTLTPVHTLHPNASHILSIFFWNTHPSATVLQNILNIRTKIMSCKKKKKMHVMLHHRLFQTVCFSQSFSKNIFIQTPTC